MNTCDFYYDCLQIRELSRDVGVYTDQELRAILNFYHSFGKITFFGEKSRSDDLFFLFSIQVVNMEGPLS